MERVFDEHLAVKQPYSAVERRRVGEWIWKWKSTAVEDDDGGLRWFGYAARQESHLPQCTCTCVPSYLPNLGGGMEGTRYLGTVGQGGPTVIQAPKDSHRRETSLYSGKVERPAHFTRERARETERAQGEYGVELV